MHTNSPAHQPAVLCMRSLLSFVFIEPFQIWCDLTSWSLHFSVYNCSPGFNYSIVNARSGVHIHTHNTLYLCQNYPHFPPLLNCKTMSLHQCTSAAKKPCSMFRHTSYIYMEQDMQEFLPPNMLSNVTPQNAHMHECVRDFYLMCIFCSCSNVCNLNSCNDKALKLEKIFSCSWEF